jgi:hypothetical protein
VYKKIIVAIAAGITVATSAVFARTNKGYAPVNGLKMYYEIHGTGTAAAAPLVLLHGSYMTIELNFSQLIPELAKSHQ